MKNFFFLVLFTVLSTSIFAQDRAVKLNPLALLGGSDLVSYEQKLEEKTSFVVSAAAGGFKLGDVKYTSFGGGGQFRYYFKESIEGPYGAGIVAFQTGKTKYDFSATGSSDSEEFNFTSFGAGVKVGWQWIWENGFTLDVNIGGSYRALSYKFDDAQNEDDFSSLKGSGFLPTSSVAVGYAF